MPANYREPTRRICFGPVGRDFYHRADFDEVIAGYRVWDGVEGDWIYAPPQRLLTSAWQADTSTSLRFARVRSPEDAHY